MPQSITQPERASPAERSAPLQAQHFASTKSSHSTSRTKIQNVRHWWFHNIVLTISHPATASSPGHDPRDHHALERTFLAYIRTSNTFVSLGVVTAQLFLLSGANRTMGAVFAALTCAIAIVLVVLGCGSFFCRQKLVLRGRISTGGWDIMLLSISTAGLCFGLFVAVLLVS